MRTTEIAVRAQRLLYTQPHWPARQSKTNCLGNLFAGTCKHVWWAGVANTTRRYSQCRGFGHAGHARFLDVGFPPPGRCRVHTHVRPANFG